MTNPIPHLRKTGNATQLIVDGQPFLVLGGELHNSSASSLAYMQPIWQRLVDLHLNTVLATVTWELVEPVEGSFDFSLVDGLIQEARRHDLRLVFLWFGAWKNGMSSYAPAWVKRDFQRFTRVVTQAKGPVEILSPQSVETQQADARAFAAFLAHLREVDGEEQTVLMVQVQNEVGVLGDSRDRSPAANAAFAGPVPAELVENLQAHKAELGSGLRKLWEAQGFPTSGSWEELFGSSQETDEIFMAWHYARYVDGVAAAGKAEYPLPLFVNAWLSSLGDEPGGWASGGQKPGEWPSGGPLPQTMDIWLAAAPQIDFLAPDIYQPQFADWCRQYTRRGNPLFIPEMRRSEDGAHQFFYALGEHDAIGVSPFAIDGLRATAENAVARSYAVLGQIAPQILARQGSGSMIGFLLDEDTPSITRQLGSYELKISLDQGFGQNANKGSGLIIAMGQDEFLGAGFGFRVHFQRSLASPQPVGILAVDEGQFHKGVWVPGRRLNGDETSQGSYWRFRDFGPDALGEPVIPTGNTSSISRCTVYLYE